MRYKEIQLNEAIIKVPSELINKANMYTGSCLYFIYNKRMNEDQSGDISQYQKALKFLQSKGAKNINETTFNNIVNNSIDLNLDLKQFFKELNYKGTTPELIRSVSSYEVSILINDKNTKYNGAVNKVGDGLVLNISIARAMVPNSDPVQTSKLIMETVYHESQHIVQYLAIEPINKNAKQLQYAKSDDEGSIEYYQSGVEFGPQLGNLVGAINSTLELMSDEGRLTGKMQTDITSAMQEAMSNPEYGGSRSFMVAVYNKDKETYRKVMKEIFKKSSEFYNELQNKEETDFENSQEEDIETKINIPETVVGNISNNSGYKLKRFGRSGNNIVEVSYDGENWVCIIDFTQLHKDIIPVKLKVGNSSESTNLSSSEIISFSKYLEKINSPSEDDIYSALDVYSRSGSIDSSAIHSMITVAKNMADGYNVPFEILSENSFSLNGHEYEIAPGTGENIFITNDDMAIDLKIKSSSFSMFMFMLIALTKAGKEDEALWAIASNTNGMGVMGDLNNLLQELKNAE